MRLATGPARKVVGYTALLPVGVGYYARLVAGGRLTGRYLGGECTGPEKAVRIRRRYDLRQFREIYAYGDSAEDREMLAIANRRYYRWNEADEYAVAILVKFSVSGATVAKLRQGAPAAGGGRLLDSARPDLSRQLRIAGQSPGHQCLRFAAVPRRFRQDAPTGPRRDGNHGATRSAGSLQNHDELNARRPGLPSVTKRSPERRAGCPVSAWRFPRTGSPTR